MGRADIRSSYRVAILVFAALSVGTGCSILGPSSIVNGRASYNDAVVATNTQQVLAMLVRMRYGEPAGLLAVTSITANLNIQSSIGSEIGFGPESNYAGSLVPLSAGLAYEENPTISYAPVQGQRYLRQLLSPLPLDLTLLILDALGNDPRGLVLLVDSINGIQNPLARYTPARDADARFSRFVELVTNLNRAGQLDWAAKETETASFVLALNGRGADYESASSELTALLGVKAPVAANAPVLIPVRLGVGSTSGHEIILRTRSLFDILSVAAAAVEVPAKHLESGLAPPLPILGDLGSRLRIRSAKRCPGDSMVAFERYGWCYSIAATDTDSKMAFRLVESLLSVRMAEIVNRTVPVLTVPVAR